MPIKIWGLVLLVAFMVGCSHTALPLRVTKKYIKQEGQGFACSIQLYDGLGSGTAETSYEPKYCAYEVGQEIK